MKEILRRRFFLLLSSALIVSPFVSNAQPTQKVRRLGILSTKFSNQEFYRTTFFPRLSELGWSEGKNLLVDFRIGESSEQLPQLAAQLVQEKVDVIFTGASPFPLEAARRATSTIPIVFAGAYDDPVAEGVIGSLARPGGNITGASTGAAELDGKRVQLLKEVVPHLARLGMLVESITSEYSRELVEAANTIGVEIVFFEVRKPSLFESVVKAAAKARVQGVFVDGTPLFSASNVIALSKLFIEHRLPSMGTHASTADRGFLMGYSASVRDMYFKAAGYVDKILRGANPGELPVEQPTIYQLAVNLKTAKALKIVVPKTILLRADRVIE